MSRTAGALPLQKKVSLTLLVVVAVFTATSYLILRTIIAPAFNDLEMDAAATDLIRAEAAMRADLENLSAITADWAPWDDIYTYVRGENPAFRKSNLDRPTLDNLDLDFMAVFALDGKLMWSQVLLDAEERPVQELEILNADNPGSNKLLEHPTSASRTRGFVRTGLGPAIVSSRPIVRSDDSGPVAGALVMGQFLDDTRLQRLRDQTEVSVYWDFADDTAMPVTTPEISQLSKGETRSRVYSASINSYKMLADIYGDSLLLLHTETPRRISALGSQTVNAGLLFLAVAGVLVTVVMWVLMRRMILRPLESLATHIDRIRESGDLTKRAGLVTDDEIGALARQFDSMTAEVHNTRQALLDQSFKAGKADTAAEVMHNIRNAMTPMINGLDRLSKGFNVAGGLRVAESLAQIGDPACDPARREKYLQYVDASFKHVEETNHDALEDMKIVTSQARQVEAILSDQERFANVAPVSEDLKVDEVVSEAAHVMPKNPEMAVQLEIDEGLRNFHVRAHKSGLLQVLGNLILNAYESIQRSDRTTGEIQLQASSEVLDDKPMIRLTVRDNGLGFDNTISKRIFQRGFTSKEKGDTNGLGLHWCANAVAGMGGRIMAESPGQGHGAEFHVLLPTAHGA